MPAIVPANFPPGSAPPGTTKNKWRRWVVLGVLLALLLFFHEAVLMGVARLLVVDDPVQGADYLLILEGERRAASAAELYHRGLASRVLLIGSKPNRLQRMNILPAGAALVAEQLHHHQVPPSAVLVVPAEARTDWETTRVLRDWLATQPPETRVLICCDCLTTRRLSYVLDQVLDSESRERIRIHPLRQRDFDETNWWRKKAGWVSVAHGVFRLGYARLLGEDQTAWPEWEPDAYEAALVENAHRP